MALARRDPGVPAYRWLCAALRGEILEGRLRPSARLPATRDLGLQYGLSRGTVVHAFEQLKAEGYVEGSVGSGTYVSAVLPDDLLQATPAAATVHPAGPPATRPRAVSNYARRMQPLSGYDVRPAGAFRANQPAVDLFPTALWAQVAARRLRRAAASQLVGCDPLGSLPLREAVAGYLGTSRGVRCTAAQVAIVSGMQEALDLMARLFLNPGDGVCMEEPGYGGAAAVFEAYGARISALPVDGEGMRLPGPRARGARLAYVTPAHQFPLGTCMSLARRLELLEWARRTGALIVEDDYDGEYRYAGRPVPALQGLDRHAAVIFAGSFSKVMFPALRLGYLVVPDDLVERVAAAISITSRHAPLLEQAVLCDFIADGHFGRHLRRMREVYAERLAVLLEGARRHLSGLLDIAGVEAGLQTAGWLAPGLGEAASAAAAAARGVEVVPLGHYRRLGRRLGRRDAAGGRGPGSAAKAAAGGADRQGLQLGFAAVDPREIRRGVRELGIALASLRRT